MKKDYINIPDETMVELFISMGMPRNLAKTLIHISQIDNDKFQKKKYFV